MRLTHELSELKARFFTLYRPGSFQRAGVYRRITPRTETGREGTALARG